jgi:hypothetical protein
MLYKNNKDIEMTEEDLKYLDGKFLISEKKVVEIIYKIDLNLGKKIDRLSDIIYKYNSDNNNNIKELEKKDVSINERLKVFESIKNKRISFSTTIVTGTIMIVINIIFKFFN